MAAGRVVQGDGERAGEGDLDAVAAAPAVGVAASCERAGVRVGGVKALVRLRRRLRGPPGHRSEGREEKSSSRTVVHDAMLPESGQHDVVAVSPAGADGRARVARSCRSREREIEQRVEIVVDRVRSTGVDLGPRRSPADDADTRSRRHRRAFLDRRGASRVRPVDRVRHARRVGRERRPARHRARKGRDQETTPRERAARGFADPLASRVRRAGRARAGHARIGRR